MGKSCSKCRKYCFSPCRSSKRKRRAESECDGRVTRHSLEKNQQLQELVFAEVDEAPESRICELETMLTLMKESHARELQLEKDSLEKALSELKDSKERDREKFQKEIKQLQLNQKKQTVEEVETHPGSRQELESLKAVLEIKNEELQKLHYQISHSCVQSDDVLSMQFQKETLRQRTEDLVMQMQAKNEQIRKYALENEKFKKLLKDKENKVVKLEQEKEQLLYRLNEISPTSPSFNPVFVTSQDLMESAKQNFNNSNAKKLHFGD